jgi:hypothetical protein
MLWRPQRSAQQRRGSQRSPSRPSQAGEATASTSAGRLGPAAVGVLRRTRHSRDRRAAIPGALHTLDAAAGDRFSASGDVLGQQAVEQKVAALPQLVDGSAAKPSLLLEADPLSDTERRQVVRLREA